MYVCVCVYGKKKKTVVQEWLAMRYKEYLQTQPASPDGYGVGYMVGKYRRDLRIALTMALVRRSGAVQLGSGLPSRSIRGDFAMIDLHACCNSQGA